MEDDFAHFMAARWPGLEAVALVATLDPVAAREATTAALASLAARWPAALDDGAPTAAARRELLTRLGSRSAPGPPRVKDLIAADPDDSVPAALLGALAGEEALVRAALAATMTWEAPVEEVAALAGRGGRDLSGQVETARGRILFAHRGALAADGLPPADHRLDDDLAALLSRLVATTPEPPDPAALVAERSGRARRRSILLGGVGAAALGTAGWFVLRAGVTPAVPRPTTPTTLGPDAPQWASTAQWAPRGSLAADPGVRRIVGGARVLFAGDTATLRIVVATRLGSGAEPPLPQGTRFSVWSGPRGAPAEQLVPIPYAFGQIDGTPDVVAVGVPYQWSAALVVLARPSVDDAHISTEVRPHPSGSVDRVWPRLSIEDGVVAADLPGPLGSATRLRCDNYDGPVPIPAAWAVPGSADDPSERLASEVADATGVPANALRTETVVDSPIDGRLLNEVTPSGVRADGRVLVTHVTTPDGGLVRMTQVFADRRSSSGAFFFGPVVIPADEPHRPVVGRIDSGGSSTGNFLVVAPGGAATAQLLATSPNAYPVSGVVPVRGGTAIVPVINAAQASAFRLVLKDGAGRTRYDDVPAEGEGLYGPDPALTGWLGLPLPYDG